MKFFCQSVVYVMAFVFSFTTVFSQNLQQVLDRYEETYGVVFSYDPEVVGVIEWNALAEEMDLRSLLVALEAARPLQVEEVSSAYYSILVRETQYRFRLKDITDHAPVTTEWINVLVNGKPCPFKMAEGEVEFAFKPRAVDTLSIYALGYEEVIIPWSRLMNQVQFELLLNPRVHELADVTIEDYVTTGINMNPALQNISIKASDLPLLPGETEGDLFASLAALPGITTPDNRAGNLFIRGSSTDQSLVMVDDIPIYHRGHYFGTISPYNPKMIEDVKVYRNGFHPRMGGCVGGAVEINTSENFSRELSAGLGANTLYGMGYARVPVHQKWSIVLGGRRSFPTSIHSPKQEAIAEMIFAGSALEDSAGRVREDYEVIFEDYNASLHFQPDARQSIVLSSLFTNSQADYIVYANSASEQNRTRNKGVNLQWTGQTGESFRWHLSVTCSDYLFQFINSSGAAVDAAPRTGPYSVNELRYFGIRQEFEKRFVKGNRLESGVAYLNHGNSYDYRNLLVDSTIFTRSDDQNASILAPFINYEWLSLGKFYLQAGLRINYYSPLNHVGLAPRLFVNYSLSDQLTLKGSTGKYYQYLSQIKNLEFSSGGFDNELWMLADNQATRPISGEQTMIGLIRSGRKWIMDAEIYYKNAQEVTYSSSVKLSPRTRFFSAEQYAYGADLFLKRKIGAKGSVWSGYTYSQMKVRFDSARDFSYDNRYSQPHVVYLGGALHSRYWKFSAGWRLASGLKARSLYMIQRENVMLNEEGSASRRGAENPFDQLPDRYDVVHFLDVSVACHLPETVSRKWSATLGLSVINAYNQTNLTDQVVRSKNGLPVFYARQAISFAPNLMLTVEW